MRELMGTNYLLQQVNTIIEKNEQIIEETGNSFNVFSVLNMERSEVQTHSALLYELLNIKGSHHQGDAYLKIFLNDVLEIRDFDLDKVIVERERSINYLGRIDMVIENPEYMFIIEMKIDAEDQENQLKRYNTYGIRSGKKYMIYYLTLSGYEASEYSTGNAEIDYKCISFEKDILNWINKCIRAGKTPLLPSIRETLTQYSKLIEKITNQVDGGVKMEIKNLLLKGNNLELAEKLVKVIPVCKAEIEYRFWKSLHSNYTDAIEKLGFDYIDDDFFENEKNDIETIVDIRKNKNGKVYLQYEIYEHGDRSVYLDIGCSAYDNNIYVALLFFEDDDIINVKDYDDTMKNITRDIEFEKANKGNKYTYLGYDLNFHTDSLLKLLDEKELNVAVKAIGDEFLEIATKLKCSLDK